MNNSSFASGVCVKQNQLEMILYRPNCGKFSFRLTELKKIRVKNFKKILIHTLTKLSSLLPMLKFLSFCVGCKNFNRTKLRTVKVSSYQWSLMCLFLQMYNINQDQNYLGLSVFSFPQNIFQVFQLIILFSAVTFFSTKIADNLKGHFVNCCLKAVVWGHFDRWQVENDQKRPACPSLTYAWSPQPLVPSSGTNMQGQIAGGRLRDAGTGPVRW